MYLNKYGFGNGTYVRLDELNDLMKAERRKRMKEAKLAHKAGDGDKKMRYVIEHGALIDLGRKINMSANGEMHLIFTRDQDGDWEFLVDVVSWDDLPEYIRKGEAKTSEWVIGGTSEIEEATLYDSFEEADKELGQIIEKTGSDAWHIVKKWMFDTKENREGLMTLFYNGSEEADEKAETIKQAEYAIERTRNALDRAEKLLDGLKDGESEKPSETAKKPSKHKGHCPGRYTVWYRTDDETTQHCMGFVRFEKGIPVFTNRPCKAMWFVWRQIAEKVAERCGDGFEVVDMIGQMTAEERLLRAIFREDGMDGEDVEPEYHGDGTEAEDEDWDLD